MTEIIGKTIDKESEEFSGMILKTMETFGNRREWLRNVAIDFHIHMPCCGDQYDFSVETVPLEDMECKCGSGLKVVEWVESG